jgi:hypothetical protein
VDSATLSAVPSADIRSRVCAAGVRFEVVPLALVRMSPAMAAGLVDRLFQRSDLVNLLIESETKNAT